MPKVTVLMPAYNAEPYLLKAVESVLNQTFTDFELVVIDDCSTDGTPAVLSQISDPRLRVLRNEQNLRLRGTLNRGLAEANGEYIARLDADDVSMPSRLEKQVAVLEADPAVGLVATLLEGMDASENTIWTQEGWEPSPEEVHYRLIFRNNIGHSTVMYRRSLALELGGYALQQCEDWDLWSRMSAVSRVVLIPEVLSRWRQLVTGLQQVYSAEVMQFERTVFAQNLARLTGDQLNADRLACFHNNLFPGRERQRVAAASLAELRKLHKHLHAHCPSWLDRAALRAYCDSVFSARVRESVCDYVLLAIPSARLRRSLWARLIDKGRVEPSAGTPMKRQTPAQAVSGESADLASPDQPS